MKANNLIETEGLVSKLDVKAFRVRQVEQSVSFEVLRYWLVQRVAQKSVRIQRCCCVFVMVAGQLETA